MLFYLTQTFLTSPFLKSNLLLFLAVSFFFCCCFCFHSVCLSLSVFCCYVGFVFGVFVLFCFVFLFLFFFLVLLSVSGKKAVFPAILVFFWVLLVKREVWFLCFMFLFLFVFLVLFLSSLKNSFVLFCFCVVVFFVTRLSGLLVCILWSFFLFCFLVVLFWILSFFVFSFLSKKRPPKKPDTAKTQKSKNAEKKDSEKKNIAIVFTNSVLQFFGVGLKFSFFAENTIKIVVLVHFKTGENTQKLQKLLSQNLVQGWVKTWSKYVAQQNWTRFWLKKMCFFLLFFPRFSEKCHSHCRKKRIFEKQKK